MSLLYNFLSIWLWDSILLFINFFFSYPPITGLDRPLGVKEVEAPIISSQSAHEGGKVLSPSHLPPLTPRRYPWYSFMLVAESTLGKMQ